MVLETFDESFCNQTSREIPLFGAPNLLERVKVISGFFFGFKKNREL